jgi:hypothetical protein
MTTTLSRRALFGAAAIFPTAARRLLAAPPAPERYVAIDDVCAWPKLVALPDGAVAAAIHNRPSHGGKDADVECWISRDQGRHWTSAGVIAQHPPEAMRNNHAIGVLAGGALIAAASGWEYKTTSGANYYPERKRTLLQAVVCTSGDSGKTWKHVGLLPASSDGYYWIPFGNIETADDGSLNLAAYVFRSKLPPRRDTCAVLRSRDGGRSWTVQGLIGDSVHNETDLMHVGKGRWLAAARTIEGVNGGVKRPACMDVLESEDDARTWRPAGFTTRPTEYPGDLCRLRDGRIALTYGSRRDDFFGVLGRISADRGKTWSDPVRIADSFERDCGYPSSAQLADGKILTAYYSRGAAQHRRYHMGVVVWDPA